MIDNPELTLCLSVHRELQRQASEIRLGLSLAASVSHREVMERIHQLAQQAELIGRALEVVNAVAEGKCCEMMEVANGVISVPRQKFKAQTLIPLLEAAMEKVK